MAKTKPARVIQFAEIERRFQVVPMTLGMGTFFPAVVKKDDGYSIRVLKSRTATTTNFDYFRTDPQGSITEAPRGYARDYRPGQIPVEELDAAVERHAREAGA